MEYRFIVSFLVALFVSFTYMLPAFAASVVTDAKADVVIQDMANAFKSMSKGNFIVEFERPGAGLSDTAKAILFDSLQMMGINPTNVKAQQKDGEKTEETTVMEPLV